tara:strand:+ start:10393 stop:11046 length:654 start_codon:yes stop_codon:yes gene_type:complete
MIQLQHVYKTYPGPVHALRGINLNIEKGEFAFITGPSGAGKTTLFKMLSGFDIPSSGKIEVADYNLSEIKKSDLPYLRRKIGVVFQDFKLLLDRSVYENVALPLKILNEKPGKIKYLVEEVLEKVGLAEKSNTVASCLSGGEQQRVAIARAIVHKPDLIIADEPTGNLDPKLSWEIMELFHQANQDGMTLIIATHDYSFFEKYKKRRIDLRAGEVQL